MSGREQPPYAAHGRSRLILLAAGLAAATLLPAVSGAGASAATCAGASARPSEVSGSEIARATLCLVNSQRRSRGLRVLRPNRRLSAAARRHARDIVRRQYFSHTAPGGSTFLQRIRRSGYLRSATRWRVGENLGWGSGLEASARAIVRAWMHSPPHRRAILTRSFRDAGVGIVRGVPFPHASGGATYTVDFGARRR
jgi:uncharacterized protein YkwD